MLQFPTPWFGGKAKIAALVWERFGRVPNYCEPFLGSGAVLLGRPTHTFTEGNSIETVNDLDGHVANFWRSCKYDPDGVAAPPSLPASPTSATATATTSPPSPIVPSALCGPPVPMGRRWPRPRNP